MQNRIFSLTATYQSASRKEPRVRGLSISAKSREDAAARMEEFARAVGREDALGRLVSVEIDESKPDEMSTLEDEFGCDPWDDENFGQHAASVRDAEPDSSKRVVRGTRW